MQAQPFPVAAMVFSLVLPLAMSPIALAAPSCTGEACDALTVSADGCAWKNISAKAVRFSLVSSAAMQFSTVLGPGETFKQTSKDVCASAAAGAPTYQAAFATLRQMPDAPDFTLKPRTAATATPAAATTAVAGVATPRAKPQLVAATTEPAPATTPIPQPASTPVPKTKPAAPVAPTTAATPAPATAATPPVAPVSVAFAPPRPRAKPALPPSLVPNVNTSPAPVATSVQVLSVPTQAEIEAGASPCGEACGDILFKVVDNCIWVQSQNPRPIMFQATIDGRMLVLALEGASYEKSAKGSPAADAVAYHSRQVDPFQQSSSAGIPVYRARLGDKATCVKDKALITQFVAVYGK